MWERFLEVKDRLPDNAGRGGIGTPDQLRAHLKGYEDAGVDQVIFVQQSGTNRHEHICDLLELFAATLLPEFKAARGGAREAEAGRAGAVHRAGAGAQAAHEADRSGGRSGGRVIRPAWRRRCAGDQHSSPPTAAARSPFRLPIRAWLRPREGTDSAGPIGAGLSAESGLATFRAEDGLWANYSIEQVCNFLHGKRTTRLSTTITCAAPRWARSDPAASSWSLLGILLPFPKETP